MVSLAWLLNSPLLSLGSSSFPQLADYLPRMPFSLGEYVMDYLSIQDRLCPGSLLELATSCPGHL